MLSTFLPYLRVLLLSSRRLVVGYLSHIKRCVKGEVIPVAILLLECSRTLFITTSRVSARQRQVSSHMQAMSIYHPKASRASMKPRITRSTPFSGSSNHAKTRRTHLYPFGNKKNPSNKVYTRLIHVTRMNGGPGSSSMRGLLGENGPCMVNDDSNSTYLNPWSWNNEVNML